MDYKPPPPYDPPPAKVTIKMDNKHTQTAKPKEEPKLSPQQQLRATNAELGISLESARRYILFLEFMLTEFEPEWKQWVDGDQAKKGIANHHAQLKIANDRAHDATKRATEMHAQIADMLKAHAKELDNTNRSWRKVRESIMSDYEIRGNQLDEALERVRQLATCEVCESKVDVKSMTCGDCLKLQEVRI